MPELIGLLVLTLAIGLVFGFMIGFAFRESISRRRRLAARMAAQPERYRELDADQTLRLE